MDLHYLELLELADLLWRRQVTSVEVTRAQLERIDRLDDHLASYTRIAPEDVLGEAETADAEITAGHYRGPLHGVPLGIKDLFWTKGVPTAAGTMIHRDFVPEEDATVVARLREAGAILLGKLQMTEGAYSDHHPTITAPKNPWNAGYWTGSPQVAQPLRPRPGFATARLPRTQANRSAGRAAQRG
jgi:amidase